jgi:hypothetical protein
MGSSFLSSKIEVPAIDYSAQEIQYNLNDELLIFHWGQKRMMSSLLWTKTMLDSDIVHYKKKDLNSWLFLRFKTLIMLDPNFIESYRYGGIYLSVIKDDIAGASYLFKLGAEKFVNDYNMQFYAGYHFLHEEVHYKLALKFFLNAERLRPNSHLIKLIVTSLMDRTNVDDEVINQRLLRLIDQESDLALKKELKQKLKRKRRP